MIRIALTMKALILSFFILLLIYSCKKSNNIEVPLENDIIYTEVIPNVIIGYDLVPDQHSWSFDLNHDSVNDFRIHAGYMYVIEPPDTVPFGYYFALHPEFPTWDSNSNVVHCSPDKLLNKDYVLSSTCHWSDSYIFFSIGINCVSDTCKYIGLSVRKNNKSYYGWIQLDWDGTNVTLRVRSFAIRKTPDLPIMTGQIN